MGRMFAPEDDKTVTAETKVYTSGKSLNVRLAAEIARATGIEDGTPVSVTAQPDGSVVVRRTDDHYTRSLASLRGAARRYPRAMAALAK